MNKTQLITIIQDSVGKPEPDLIVRQKYSSWLKKKVNNNLIKVVTGFRRVGKSTLLKQLYLYLISKKNISPDNIFFVNYEHALLVEQRNTQDLYRLFQLFENSANPNQPLYLFLDEIQNVKNWESFVRTLFEKNKHHYNIFISGSNSSLLSSEFTTALGGRTVELHVTPFNFNEFLKYHQLEIKSIRDLVNNQAQILNLQKQYLKKGGLPETLSFKTDLTKEYLESTFNKVLLDDIIQRFKLEKPEILKNLFHYVVTNTSSILSYHSLVNFMKRQRLKTSVPTVKRYLNHYQEAFALNKIAKFSWKTKEVFTQKYKYYPVDHGFINFFSTSNQQIKSKILECVVFNHLKKDHFKVYYGRDANTNKELDFIVQKNKNDALNKIQVCWQLDKKNCQRELGNFIIADKYLAKGENILITKTGVEQEHRLKKNTIKQIPLHKFLLFGY